MRGLKKTGLVYKSGETIEAVPVGIIIYRLRHLAKWLLRLSYACIFVALLGAAWILSPWLVAEVNYRLANKSRVEYLPSHVARPVSKFRLDGKLSVEALRPSWHVPDIGYSVFIPKIGAISRVVPQVDAGNSLEYTSALKLGVAEAKGLSRPGEVGTTYLFAHSVGSRLDYARYNAVFYLLDKVEAGDFVEVMYRGWLYQYQVQTVEITEPDDVRYLIPQQNEEKLVLQTCYPPGTTRKRLVVVARPSEVR